MNNFRPLFLLAVPQLVDPMFKKSVVLILQHNHEGAFGFIVNSPLHISLFDFAERQEMGCDPALGDQNIFCGGPVEPYRGWVLHDIENLEEKQEVVPGLYVSGSQESLRSCLEQGLKPFRLVLGCSAWQSQQLEKEMSLGSWIAVDADPKYIFYSQASDTWDAILHDLGIDPMTIAHGTGLH